MDCAVIQISNREAGRSVLSITHKLTGKANESIAPRLVFRCGDRGCALSEIWTVAGGVGVPVSHVRSPEYLASIPLAVSKK